MVHRAGFVGRMGPPLRRRGVTIFSAGMNALPSYITFTRASSAQDFNDPALTYSTNVPVLNSSGLLLQGARTNLLLNSATLSTQSITTTAAAHTLSFYGTGTVTLSGTSTAGPLVGTGANNRVTLTFTPTAGTLTLTVTGTVTQAQCELGSFASSYIPTTGTTVTRSADVATISNLASIGFNASQGTFIVRANFIGLDGTNVQRLITLHDGTGTNNIVIYKPTTAAIQGQAGGAFSGTTAIVAGTTYTSGLAYNFSNNAFYVGGSNLTGSMGTGSLSASFNGITIGNNFAGTVPCFAYISQIFYSPIRIPNGELAIRTA